MQGVRSALDLHVHRRAAGHALLGIEAVGDDVDRLDRFDGRRVGLQALNPLVRRADAVETEHRVRVRRAVDCDLHRSRRVVDAARLEIVGLRHTRRQREHALKAASVDRQVLQLLAGRLRLHGRRFGLQQHRIRRHQHRFLKRAYREAGIDTDGRVQPNRDVARLEGLKPRQCDFHLIGADRDVRKVVAAGFIRRRLARLVRLDVRDLHGRAGHGQIGRIRYGADDGSVEDLCAGGCRQQGERDTATTARTCLSSFLLSPKRGQAVLKQG